MRTPLTPRRRGNRTALAVATASAVALVPVLGAPAAAAPDGSGVVINEVYARGGSANQPFTHKFVELYNPTDAPISLDGTSLQYRSATGTGAATTVVPLSGTIPAGGHYLVQGGSNGSVGEALPAPDVSGNLNLSGASGTVALVESASAVTLPTGDVVGASDVVVDLVGYGTSNTYEGSGPAATSGGNSTPQALVRTDGVDTDDNAADLTTTATPTPQGTGGQPADPGEPEGPVELSIAEIQGTGDASPYVGQEVVTTGVVTAVYAEGGLDGLYLQTPGTGGAPEGHTASHGVFVYGSRMAAAVEVGDYVEVTAEVAEFQGLTELTYPEWTFLEEEPAEVVPLDFALPATDEERERFEGMLVAPGGPYTVTNTYPTNQYGSVGLAAGEEPLVQPSDVANPRLEPEAYAAVAAENDARGVVLDDGSSWNYLNFNRDYHESPVPYLSAEQPLRVGAAATFVEPVVFTFSRYDGWVFQPRTQVVGLEGAPVTFENTREAAPEDVGGDVAIATFNVLNYFTTLGEEYSCDAYTDREGDPVSARDCLPRGAYEAEDLERQEAKITEAINALGADVVALEEIENSIHFTGDRDTALADLTAALNDAAGAEVWAYVPSPAAIPAEEDVIRNAFVYRADRVTPVGESVILDDPAFDNAREPLGQAFRGLNPGGRPVGEEFVVVTNHFKSKGSGEGPGNDVDEGQGLSNADRVEQARALAEFVDATWAEETPVFLVGDFNSYTAEDPMLVLQDAGYTNVAQTLTDEETYNFGGMDGSLDHVLADAEAWEMVQGADIWRINSPESIALEYSRHNYNVTQLYDTSAFRSSDHDPVLVGIEAVPGRAPDHVWARGR